VAISSVLLLISACAPARTPKVSANDPNSSESSSKGGDEPAEAWGSSETSEAAHIKGNAVTSTPSTGSSTSSDTSTGSATPSDGGPHVAADLGGQAYDRATLEVSLKRAARQVSSNCGAATDDTGTASGPWGKTTITVKLGHNGHSRGGTVPPPFDGKTTGRCSVQAFTNLIYAPFAGSDVDVDWPIEIKKP